MLDLTMLSEKEREVVLSLRKEIIDLHSDKWELNDSAHRVDHFDEVLTTGLTIAKKLCIIVNLEWIVLVAYYHDMFAHERKTHHALSAKYVREADDPILNRYSDAVRDLVSRACTRHRASYKGKFINRFEELMNSADRGKPSSVEALLERAVQFRMDREGLSKDEALKGATEHVKEKYGTNGYARYPDMYIKVFGEELRKVQKEVDEL